MFRAFAVAAGLFLAAASSVQAQTWTIHSSHSAAQFAVRHMMVTTVRGAMGKVTGTVTFDPAKPAAGSIEATIDVKGIDTREPGRDKHLVSADFFDAEKFPTISFKSSKVAAAGKDRYDVTGTFTVRGVTKEITLPVAVLGFGKGMRGEDRVAFEIQTVVNRKDYGVNWNRTLDTGGLGIAPESATVHHALGLLMIRTGEQKKASHHLRKAVLLGPENARYGYVHGIALSTLEMSGQAVSVLKKALNHNSYDRDLLVSLATIHRDRGEFEKALRYAVRLIRNYPGNQDYQQLEQQLRVLAARQGDKSEGKE